MGHVWHPIEPLPDDWKSWADTEIAAIKSVIVDLRAEMGEEAANRLHNRMLTEWSVETGMVEGLYHWDRGVTETLLTHGVRADRIPGNASAWSPERVAQVLHDQIEVVEGLFSFVKAERPLGTSFIHELHAHLLRNTQNGFELGKWKALPNRVELQDGSVHEYCPPEHVTAEMDRLLEMSAQYAAKGVPVEIRAAWLHHRFTEIHPYPDGNGRTARALASLLLIQNGLFPLIIRRAEKGAYIDALEKADRRNLAPLIKRIRTLQRREVVKMNAGLPLSYLSTSQPATLDASLQRVGEKLGCAPSLLPEKGGGLLLRAEVLRLIAAARIDSMAAQLRTMFGKSANYRFETISPIGETASSLGLRADRLDYIPRYERINQNACVRLAMPEQWHIIASIHEASRRTTGVAMCVVFLSAPSPIKVPPSPSEYFLLTCTEPWSDCRSRFKKWFEDQLIKAIDEWQRLL